MSHALQEITACFGQPVAGNPSQYIMEKAYAKAGLDWRYLTLEVPAAQLKDAVLGARAMGFRGFNCTIPHKCAVIELLDGTTEAAGLMGAVNCVFRQGDKLLGDNTDGKGFVQSLRSVTDPAGKRVVILGAGGAARAIAVEVALAGAIQVDIVNRNAERGQELSSLIADKVKVASKFIPWEGQFEIPEGTNVLINGTSIGLGDANARVPVATASLKPGLVAADVIFNPPDTRFLQEAAAQGCTALDGLGMLVNQAVINFKNWTGVDPDRELMKESLEEFLGL